MLRILLVEDEPPILRDVLGMLDNLSNRCSVLATANNGRDALSILEKNSEKIDLLLTDIQMPVVNGLALIEIVKEKYPDIVCVILSGYNEFEYAKTAIRLGVCEYLLKPLQERDLENLIDRMQRDVIRKKMEAYVKTPVNCTKYCPMPEANAVYVAGVLCVGLLPYGPVLSNPFDESYWKDGFAEALEFLDSLTSCSYWVFDGSTYSEKNILFTFDKMFQKQIPAIMRSFFGHLKFKHYFTLGLHTDILCLSEIGNSLGCIRKQMPYKITIERSTFFYSLEGNDTVSKSAFHAELLFLQNLFISLQFDFFKSELKKLLWKMKQSEYTQDLLVNTLFSLYNMCLTSDNSELPTQSALDVINDIINNSWDYETLTINLISLYKNLTEEKLNAETVTDNKEHLLLKIDYYIQKNFAKIRTIQDLAEKFNYSPAYLSKLFLEYKNISPTEYIINLRIEKAKDLLSSSKKVKEVAMCVGYTDPLYFGKLFKKRTGMSPKQYIENPFA